LSVFSDHEMYDPCARCGAIRVLNPIRHGGEGEPRFVCDSCLEEALEGSDDFWRWFLYEGDAEPLE
jgi:hypothetical protein